MSRNGAFKDTTEDSQGRNVPLGPPASQRPLPYVSKLIRNVCGLWASLPAGRLCGPFQLANPAIETPIGASVASVHLIDFTINFLYTAVEALVGSGDTFSNKTDIAPEALDRDMSVPHLLLDLVKSLRRLLADHLELLRRLLAGRLELLRHLFTKRLKLPRRLFSSRLEPLVDPLLEASKLLFEACKLLPEVSKLLFEACKLLLEESDEFFIHVPDIQFR
jgi:hypothetical protein